MSAVLPYLFFKWRGWLSDGQAFRFALRREP